MVVDLNDATSLPPVFVERLKGIEALCLEYEYSEELVKLPVVAQIVADINVFCNKNNILGYHYSRANPERILLHGLRSRAGSEIRDTFIEEYGSLFTNDEIQEIKKKWGVYFNKQQSEVRGNRIFFNFTDIELGRGGSELLIGLYGGEQVSMCFEIDEPIGKKLGSIGRPILVRCILNPGDVEVFIANPWGKIAVSSFHKLLNKEALRIDCDGYQKLDIAADNIFEVRDLSI